MELREITYLAIALRIVTAAFIGGLLGLERELKNRAAGLRTYMLVCVGACLIMMTNQYIFQCFGTGDPVRMGAQVVSGIGFLGAGTIIVTRHNQIKGLTTAAGLWTAAGVGLALGIGFYEAAVAGALAISFVLTLMQHLDVKMHNNTKRIEIYFELTQDATLGDFFRNAHELDMDVSDLQRDHGGGAVSTSSYTATIKIKKRRKSARILDDIVHFSSVAYVEEL